MRRTLAAALVLFCAWTGIAQAQTTTGRVDSTAAVAPRRADTVFHTQRTRDITATLVDLAVRGFIRIEEVTESHLLGLSKSTDYILHILRNPSQWTGLKPHEYLYLEKLSELAPIGDSW